MKKLIFQCKKQKKDSLLRSLFRLDRSELVKVARDRSKLVFNDTLLHFGFSVTLTLNTASKPKLIYYYNH